MGMCMNAGDFGGQKIALDHLEQAVVTSSCELPHIDAGNRTLALKGSVLLMWNCLSSP